MAKRRSAAVSLRVDIFLFVILIITSGQALGADHVIKVGTIQPDSHPDCVLMREVFQEYVEKSSNGRIKVELYPNAQLGGDREMSEGGAARHTPDGSTGYIHYGQI
jgi:TRAP-type C4-dicarboxylate transport system substrate-binding protein